MPYVKSSERFLTGQPELDWIKRELEKPGNLNYVITEICIAYLERKGLNYNDGINAVIGALECAKLELYRRVAAPYEDTKIKVNGDVYPFIVSNKEDITVGAVKEKSWKIKPSHERLFFYNA